MPISDADLAEHDALAQAFIRHLREILPRGAIEEVAPRESTHDPILVVRVPAAATVVGDLLIRSYGAELITTVGDHTHHHRGVYLFGRPDDPFAIEQTAVAESHWVRDLLADRIVVWSQRDAERQVIASGTELLGDELKRASWSWQRFATEAWHWSGRPYTLGERI